MAEAGLSEVEEAYRASGRAAGLALKSPGGSESWSSRLGAGWMDGANTW